MTVANALRGVLSLGLDSAPIIYYVERHPAFHALVLPFFKALDDGQIQCVTPTVTLVEVLTLPLRSNDVSLIRQYRGLLLTTEGLDTVALSDAIGERAAYLRAHYNLRTPDAVQVATAIHSGCDAFLTNDNGLRKVSEINVIVLSELVP